MVTEGCLESRMRSRTSRGVPEWSGGKDLYMGSHHTVTGSVRGYAGIVPGPPKGFRGSTGRVHQPRRALWAVGGREPAPKWAGRHPPRAHAPRVGGETLKGVHPLAWGASPPPFGRRPPLGFPLEGRPPCPSPPIYRGVRGGLQHHNPRRSPSPPQLLSSSA